VKEVFKTYLNILAINSFTRESKHFGIAIYTKGIVKIIELENVFR